MSGKSPEKNPDKNKVSKSIPLSSTDIFSARRHNMDYVTVDGVIRRTGYSDKSDWYLLCIKELLDNDIDFEWKYYPGSKDAAVNVDIAIDDSFFHLKVRNTNSMNIQVFQNLSAMFDYDMTYGYYFNTEREMREFSRAKREKMTVQDIVEEVLLERKRAAGL